MNAKQRRKALRHPGVSLSTKIGILHTKYEHFIKQFTHDNGLLYFPTEENIAKWVATLKRVEVDVLCEYLNSTESYSDMVRDALEKAVKVKVDAMAEQFLLGQKE